MSHTHENCTAPKPGGTCTDGQLTDRCDYDTCDNEYCSDEGHCECKCHSGKTCGCGHSWPRMAKWVKREIPPRPVGASTCGNGADCPHCYPGNQDRSYPQCHDGSIYTSCGHDGCDSADDNIGTCQCLFCDFDLEEQ